MQTARVVGEIQPTVRQAIAAQFRAELARLDVSARELARRMEVAHTWVTERRKGSTAIGIEDVYRMAPHLGVDPDDLLTALRPQRAVTPDTPSREVDTGGFTNGYTQGNGAVILSFQRCDQVGRPITGRSTNANGWRGYSDGVHHVTAS